MGVKVKMVTGDQLAIAIETAKKLGLGTGILDAASLGDVKKQESKEMAESPSKKLTVSPRYFPSTNSTLWMSCKNTVTLSA
jgi:magnesium-transporting ATPase (P-type)